MRIGFGIRGLRDLAPLARGILHQNQIAILRKDRLRAALIGFSEGRRREPRFLFRELTKPRAIAVHHVGIERRGHRLRSLFPLEIDPGVIAGPAHLRRLIAHQIGPPHQIVDSERELRLARAGRQRTQHQTGGKNAGQRTVRESTKHILHNVAEWLKCPVRTTSRDSGFCCSPLGYLPARHPRHRS